MNKQTLEMLSRLTAAGISLDDALALRRAAMTLHRWHELECGDMGGCIEREESDPDGGRPFWRYSTGQRGAYLPDREKGARKRIGKVLERYSGFQAYIQGDPRGAALYVLLPGTVRDGEDVSLVYSRGIAVYLDA